MRIRLVVLAIATLDSWLMFFTRQAQAVDTSVWIALIAGVVGLLTLIIQTYGQLQLARIKDKQAEQAAAVTVQTKKLDELTVKNQEVHTLVNSGQSRLIDDVKRLTAQVVELRTAADERTRFDAMDQARQQGAADAVKVAAQVAAQVTADAVKVAAQPSVISGAPLGATDSKPMHVEVVNPDPVKVVETKPTAPKE